MTSTTLVARHNRREAERRSRAGSPTAVGKAEAWRRRAPLLPALIFMIIVTQIPFLVTIWYSLRSWNLR